VNGSDEGQEKFITEFVIPAIEKAQEKFPEIKSEPLARYQPYNKGETFTVPECFFTPKEGKYNLSPEELDKRVFVNAWDCWSALGNGNFSDRSADGFWGRSTAISLLGWPISNQKLRYVPAPTAEQRVPKGTQSVRGAGFGTVPTQLDARDFGSVLPEKFKEGKNGVRQKVLMKTIRALETASPSARYHRLAHENVQRWRKEAGARGDLANVPGDSDRRCEVRVLPGDWGQVTQDLTKEFGTIFASLNMANAHVPGGGYTDGMVAQEENMFRRTDCHFSLDRKKLERKNGKWNYKTDMTNLLNAVDGKVYLDKEFPRVCIRGPEDRSQQDMGYAWLADDEVFPFYELRAAAVDLRRSGGFGFDPGETEKRIAAQLDTLIKKKVRHVVLSAFGCGAFMNPADQVATIYRQELLKRATQFDVVAFGIFHAGYGPNNFDPFEAAFDTW
jgi:hypothetical protein